jgi:hypothetical protein
MGSEEHSLRAVSAEEWPHIERRSQPRWIPPNETYGTLIIDGTARSLWSRVIDISGSGIALMVNQTLPVGAFFTLQLRNTAKNQTCIARGRVVHVEELDPGNYATGCLLEKALDDFELNLFIF